MIEIGELPPAPTPSAFDTIRAWSRRHVLVAGIAAVLVALVIGLPTDVIPNPVFGRPVPVTWWSYPTLAVTAVLGGLLSAVMGGLGITVGLGFYLPFNIVLTYSLGTLAREISNRAKGNTWSEEVGIPIAAGLIIGEALVGVGNALIIVFA